MIARTSEDFLSLLTRTWRRKMIIRSLLISMSVALLLMAIIRFLLGTNLAAFLLGAAAAGLVLCAAHLFFAGLKSATAGHIAKHLNRTVPELQESSELLLRKTSSLSVLGRMQRARLLSVIPRLGERALLPKNALNPALALSAASLFAVVFALVVPPINLLQNSDTAGNTELASEQKKQGAGALPLKVESVEVRISPPPYTGKAVRTVSAFDLTAEEGSQLKWTLRLNQEVSRPSLVFSNGDTVRLQYDGLAYVGTRTVQTSELYYLNTQVATGPPQALDYHTLKVIEDREPTLIIVTPEPRTVLQPSEPRRISLSVIADDDFGVTKAQIVATVTKGSGEGVKFREERLQFDEPIRSSRPNVRLNKLFDLEKLGMTAGDELYFYVEAWDNRAATANYSQSETYFVIWQDTSAAQATASLGLSINPIPEYFRSQRQIIIDTEKLIQDSLQIGEGEFKRRSNNLGIDQKALRLRYGQFLGEEFETGFSSPTATDSPGNFALAEEDYWQEESEEADSGIPAELRHDHDYEENATLFSQAIKDLLKAALAEMWDAELGLRILKPKEALPFEYRALVLLKRVQQASRVYVNKIGFEPTPLKPIEKRLSGDLDEIVSRRWTKAVSSVRPNAEAREALRVVRNLKRSARTDRVARAIGILESAGRKLSQQAIEQPGKYLDGLKNLRNLITTLQKGGELCEQCLSVVEMALWKLLPIQEPVPDQDDSRDNRLARRYFQKLGENF